MAQSGFVKGVHEAEVEEEQATLGKKKKRLAKGAEKGRGSGRNKGQVPLLCLDYWGFWGFALSTVILFYSFAHSAGDGMGWDGSHRVLRPRRRQTQSCSTGVWGNNSTDSPQMEKEVGVVMGLSGHHGEHHMKKIL